MAGIDKIDKASTAGQVADQYQTGWWNRLTGGKTEKASAVAMANVDRDFQSSQALRSMNFTAQEAQKNRDYQERLSNTAYQRARDDMIKAGLNPALMYAKGGMSSATPSGSIGSGAQGGGSRSIPPASSTGQIATIIASAIGATAYALKSSAGALATRRSALTYKYFK